MIRGLGLSGGSVSCTFIGSAARERREPGSELLQDGGMYGESATLSLRMASTIYELIIFGAYHLGSRLEGLLSEHTSR
jgi:hypothetical protein